MRERDLESRGEQGRDETGDDEAGERGKGIGVHVCVCVWRGGLSPKDRQMEVLKEEEDKKGKWRRNY